jgi:hypothetical protein
MPSPQNIAAQIAELASSSNYLKILQPLEIGKEGRQNELVLFMKPELFMVADPASTRHAAELILQKLDEYQAEVHGVALVGGQFLADKQIMDRHYGFINKMSKNASKIVSEQDKARIASLLNLTSLDGIGLLGGHEYLQKYPGDTIEQLDELWFTKKSLKVQSGFYIQLYETHHDRFILINGFHPGQLNHFTHPDHRIALFLVHSDTAWKALRGDMVGNTYPEKAAPSSIRGAFFAEPARYGLGHVDISTNGVHLSAGPFEGVFEIVNFFGSLTQDEASRPLPLLVERLMARRQSSEAALKVAGNPPVVANGKASDLFSATEDFDTGAAIEFWLGQTK